MLVFNIALMIALLSASISVFMKIKSSIVYLTMTQTIKSVKIDFLK